MIRSLKSPGKLPKGLLFNVVTFVIALIIVSVIFGTMPKGGRDGSSVLSISNINPSVSPRAAMMQKGSMNSVGAATGGYAAYDYDMAESAVDYYGGDEMMIMPVPPPGMPPVGGNAGSPGYPEERKVIRSGNLALLVNDVDAAATRVAEIAVQMNGFVDAQYISQYTSDQKSGSVNIRVPSERFAETISALKGLAVRVTNDQISSNDVSTQFVDLEADIKNYKVEEKQYQEIMERSGKVSEILEVARALAQVRGNIERAEGQFNYLSRQVAMSSISVSLQPVSNAKEITNEWKPALVVKGAFRDLAARATNLVDMTIAFLIGVLPILIVDIVLFLLIMFGIWKLARYAWKKGQSAILPPKV